MSVSIELLDDYHKNTQFTIIVGESILLKFVPNTQARAKMRDVINISDLPKSVELSYIKDIVKLSKELKGILGSYVKTWQINNLLKDTELQKYKEQMTGVSTKIADIERNIGISICDSHHLSFCINCKAYIGETDNLTTKCSGCNNALNDSGNLVVSYLDGLTNSYLEGGFWFEDYIERILTNMQWKVWTHGSVMGNSGIMHPVDFIAVKNSRVLIGECKTGSVDTRDISHFLVQKLDIPSHFGLFLSLQPCSAKSTASFFNVSTSKLVDDIGNKTDKELLEQINNHMEKFS